MVDAKVIGSRLTLLGLATGFFMVAWSGDVPPQSVADSWQVGLSESVSAQQDAPGNLAKQTADRWLVVGLEAAVAGHVDLLESTWLPQDMTPGMYLMATNSGESRVVHVTADQILRMGRAADLPPRDLYVLTTRTGRRYFIRLDADDIPATMAHWNSPFSLR